MKERSSLRKNRTNTTYVSAWTLHLAIALHLWLVTYKKVKKHYCPFKSCEGAKQLLHNFKKALPKGGTDGGCRAWLQSDSERHSASGISFAPSRSWKAELSVKSLSQNCASTRQRFWCEYLSVNKFVISKSASC